jgi:serine acetyltransferase
VSGNVKIGQNCYIGSGSKIRDNINVGDFSLVGMGSVVVKEIKSHMSVAGNPARTLD